MGMGEYTSLLRETILYDGQSFESEEELLAYLESPDHLRHFSERLLYFCADVWEIQIPEDPTEVEKIRKKFRLRLRRNLSEIGSDISRNTVNNWFECRNDGPKKGETDRDNIYQVAFALHLDVDRTRDLFRRVYLDRAFVARAPKEII